MSGRVSWGDVGDPLADLEALRDVLRPSKPMVSVTGDTQVAARDIALASSTNFIIHPGGGGLAGLEGKGRRYIVSSWGVSEHRCYAGVHHNNANRTKKSKRKQAQASRRKNRG